MSSEVVATIVRMMETLPEAAQNQLVEHLREYLEEIQDEIEWDQAFDRTQDKLASAAQQVRQAILEGQAKPLNIDDL